jgi:hypothetical protein
MLIDSEKRKIRLQICDTCEMNKLGVCKKCGCILSLKTMLANEKCPIGKWDKDSQKENNETNSI